MTHEIMNSVAPISSLSDTLSNTLIRMQNESQDDKQSFFDDLKLGIETIKSRSNGLLSFAQSYRSFNKTIQLSFSNVSAAELFGNLYLMAPSLEQKGIHLKVEIENPMPTLHIDRELIEQVLINLITNAADAVREKPNATILLYASISPNGKTTLKVADNGNGISNELLDKIFIPFFSTKKKGSGIGLSLSRQIVQQHKANIQVQTKEGVGSIFSITI